MARATPLKVAEGPFCTCIASDTSVVIRQYVALSPSMN
jgi:hypothetical protein